MLFVQELHGEKQEQQHHCHIIYHPGQVKNSLDEIDEGLIDADRRQNVCQNPLCPDHICDARGHIQEKEHAEGQHRRDHLAFCQGRQEKPDGQAGRAKQSVTEDRSVGHGKGYASKLQQNQRIQAQHQHRDQKYRQHGQVFSRHDLPDGHRGCQQQLIRLLLFLLRHTAHGQHRHHDEQHEIDGGQDDPNPVPKWMELPAVEQNDDCKFYSHDMRLAGRTVRNYSFLWDRDNLVAHWVAYPLNSSLIGNGDRTDEWGYDPKVPKDEQPVLFNGFQGGYDRGHQLPSADRYTDNESTFYFTNMTPQLGSLNQKMWEALESRVRDWARTADTLYVVTGCVLEGSLGTARDNNGTAVTVPGGYFKAVLRYQPSSSIGYGGYVAAGFFFEHRSYGNGSITSDMGMSIDELEERTGLDFFVNLKEKYPTLADKIEAQDPATVGLWWN